MCKSAVTNRDYGWLDKVLQMSEGADRVRSCRFHMDGELASASEGLRIS